MIFALVPYKNNKHQYIGEYILNAKNIHADIWKMIDGLDNYI